MALRKSGKRAVVFIAIAVAGLCAWHFLHARRAQIAEQTAAIAVAIAPRVKPRPLPGALSGTVRSAEAAIAGARVCATSATSQALGTPQSACAESDESGNYAIDGLPPGAYLINAVADGFLPGAARAGQPILIPAGKLVAHVDLTLLLGGARVAGHVVDVTGGPLPGATIAVTFGVAATGALAITSGADGGFVFSGPPGMIALNASAPGYATARVAHIAPSTDLVIEMIPGSTIEGMVTTADGKPVPDVEVRAIPLQSGESPANPSAVSNAAGQFRIEAVETGEYGLKAVGDDWLGQSETTVVVGIADTLKDVKVVVWPAAHVYGSVVSARDGQPCRQGQVSMGPLGTTLPYDPPEAIADVSRPGPPVPQAIAAIEADGSVHLRGLVPGPYHVVVQCEEQLLVSGPSSIEVPQAGLDGVTWKVNAGLGLIVRVVDEANQPVPGAPFQLIWPERGTAQPPIMMPLTADSSGRYETPAVLFPGRYTLRPEAGYEAAPLPLDLREGMGKVEVDYHIKGQGSALVTVRTPDAKSVDSVRVSVTNEDGKGTPRAAVALGDGRFQVRPLSPGAYDVEVADDLNPPTHARLKVVNGVEAEAAIVLERSAAIRGRVLEADNQPAADVWVNVDCRQRDQPVAVGTLGSMPSLLAPVKRVISDDQGMFAVSGISRQSSCRLRAEEPYGSVSTETLVRAGDDVQLRLQATGTLIGTARTAEGQPVERFTLSLRYATGQSRSEIPSSLGQAWTMRKVAPGKMQLQAYDQTGRKAQLEIDLAPGQKLTGVQLVFQASASAQLTPQP